VLRRTSLLVRPDGTVEARFRAGLPAQGRRILGREAAALLCEAVPRAVTAGLLHESLDAAALRRHVETVEDAVALRAQLAPRGLVTFVADGAILPRRSGIDDRPLDAARATPFRSPAALRVTLRAPNAGEVAGMGIPEGITLLVGGGFHGKSTLLRAIERGVYDHLPGDGRERVVTVGSAVKVRAEDGRRVAGTDISNFIGTPARRHAHRALPHRERVGLDLAGGGHRRGAGGRLPLPAARRGHQRDQLPDPRRAGAGAGRQEHEPITPFIDRARELHRDHGVSVVLVVGGSGDYFDVADTVIAMRDFVPHEVTATARRVAEELPTARAPRPVPGAPSASAYRCRNRSTRGAAAARSR
jgi:predicted ABC-class ATPase